MCFTFFFVLSVSEARSIFILKLEGDSHWPVFFPGGIHLPASLGLEKPDFVLFLGLISQIRKLAAYKPNVRICEYGLTSKKVTF